MIRYTQFFRHLALLALSQTLVWSDLTATETMSDYVSHQTVGRSILFTTTSGQRLRLTPYGKYIVRVQAVREGEEFFPDDRYEMVESHNWGGSLHLSDESSSFTIHTDADDGIEVRVSKSPLRLSFFQRGGTIPLLQENDGISWDMDGISTDFAFNSEEHFTGLGHGYYGRSDRIDLRGELLRRNYGDSQGDQAPLIVPFFLSSKGYGIFLNSTFPNTFDFGKDTLYEFSIDGGGRMDYFFILGPLFSRILDRYTQLTGRPSFPPRAVFGLGLSDKANDENSADPSDERWWKKKVSEHRSAGFPIDHLINDNRWRAGGGKRCESYFEWDTTRFPDPREYEQWLKANGLILTIDFNRCIAKASEGWKPSYNIPDPDSIDFGDSAPDFTRPEVRDWFWRLFWKKSLNPSLGFPGDALWIDEFDELGKAPLSMTLGNGRTWAEMKNYWFFLIAKSLVQEGWDKKIGPSRRPFVWVRGMTAGAQRYATLWSGDIKPNYGEMEEQVRGMQLAGLSGFPFWGHDAGGFYDWEEKRGPDDTLYCRWSMAFGSFSPYWKPHGMGRSRWPLDRGTEAQTEAKRYAELRYALMPYTYTFAHEAAATGMPLARALVIGHQSNILAWKYDLEYMWGSDFLVAPECSTDGPVALWLPAGKWYDFWTDSLVAGNQECLYPAPDNRMPLFAMEGSIIPMAPPALSTAFLRDDSLILHVYTGKDGTFTLYEDDGRSEYYRTENAMRTTAISFIQSIFALDIEPASGSFDGAPIERRYCIEFHGVNRPRCMELNGRPLKRFSSREQAALAGEGIFWDRDRKILTVFTRILPVNRDLLLDADEDCGEE
ncbi:MAG TPA: TIM-barrel domain-containing protein [Bacteroidota bacterium]|nr:TIM-barrel domain-containing protein [Bacteroidota bacterium]